MGATERKTTRPEPGLELVLLARHGETEWNRLGIRQGQHDSALTARGRAQAGLVAISVAEMQPDGVFTSPLGRSAATAQLCAEHLGVRLAVIDELAEVHHGVMAGLTSKRAFPGDSLGVPPTATPGGFPVGRATPTPTAVARSPCAGSQSSGRGDPSSSHTR